MRTFWALAASLVLVPAAGSAAPPPSPPVPSSPPAAGSPAAGALPAAKPANPATATATGSLRLVTTSGGALEIYDGAQLVTRFAPQTPALRRGTPILREVDIDGHRVAELRVPVRGTPSEEIWIGELAGPARRVLWTGLTGPRDADGETSIWVDVSPERVTEYQTAAGIDRCDGQPPRLFPRGYDFDAGRFRPIVSPLPPPAATTLTAHRNDPQMPAGRPVGDFHFIGASTTRGAGSDARGLTAPVELDDGNPATSWAEGLGGDGRGEFLTARAAAGGYAVRGLRIIPGDASSPAAFRQKNRVRKLQIAVGPRADQRFDVEIPDGGAEAADAAHFRSPYWVALPKPVVAACVTVLITGVTPGTEAAPPKSYGTTAISELALFTDADGPGGAERLVSDLAAAPDCASRLPLVVDLGAPAVKPTAAAVKTAAEPSRECLLEALTALEPAPKDPEVIEALAAAVVGADEKEERLIGAALARTTPASAAVAPLAALLASTAATPGDRARAARLLAMFDDEAAGAALLAALGHGPPALRAAVVEAAARSPQVSADALLAALATALTPSPSGAVGSTTSKTGPVIAPAVDPAVNPATTARAADLVRALPAAVKRSPDRRPAAIAVLRAVLASDRPFELRGRAVLALGALGPGAAGDLVAGLAAVGDDPVLRFLATRELGDARTADAAIDPRPTLRNALGDQDPRVRETAALGLAELKDTGAGAALIAGAKQEPWPFVRRAEVEALGRLCVAGGGDLMIRAVERDVDEVRRAALGGLVRCKDPRAREVLLHTLNRRNENASLRALAAGLLAETGDHDAAPEMAAALHRLVVESEADLALEGVTVAVLRALARLGGPEAVKAAVALAGDTHHPFRAAAADVLGTLCDPQAGAAALRSLRASGDPALATAAERAEKRCAK